MTSGRLVWISEADGLFGGLSWVFRGDLFFRFN